MKKLVPTLIAASILSPASGADLADILTSLKPKDAKASITLNGGGNTDIHGQGYRHILSAKAGPLVMSSLVNVEAGKPFDSFYGKFASVGLDAGHGFQPRISAFRRKDLGTGQMKTYECLDLSYNNSVSLGKVKLKASASYLVPPNHPADHFLVPQVIAEVPKLGTLRGFMNYIIKHDKRFYEGEWSRTLYERDIGSKLKVRIDAMAQGDLDFARNKYVRAGFTFNPSRK